MANRTVPEIPSCTEAEWQESKRRTDEWASVALPNGWIEITDRVIRPGDPGEGNRAYVHRDGRRVIGSVGQHDGRWWLHVSVSREKRIPSYDDLADVKRVFIGDDFQAVQVFPRRERHVNIMPTCLHLWACLDANGDGLPDFGKHGTI